MEQAELTSTSGQGAVGELANLNPGQQRDPAGDNSPFEALLTIEPPHCVGEAGPFIHSPHAGYLHGQVVWVFHVGPHVGT